MRKLAVQIAPFASALILLLLPLVLSLPIRPPLVLAAVFYWASRGDSDFDSVIGLALLGLTFDFIEPTRFGLNALMLLSFYFAVRYQKFLPLRRAGL